MVNTSEKFSLVKPFKAIGNFYLSKDFASKAFQISKKAVVC